MAEHELRHDQDVSERFGGIPELEARDYGATRWRASGKEDVEHEEDAIEAADGKTIALIKR